jgi:hypothetical protein
VTTAGPPAADASIAVEVITTTSLCKVQLGWAGFPAPYGEGWPGRSPADPPPWPAPEDPHWVLVDETDGSAWAWDGRRWALENPPLTHPIPATEVELSARALYSERSGDPGSWPRSCAGGTTWPWSPRRGHRRQPRLGRARRSEPIGSAGLVRFDLDGCR